MRAMQHLYNTEDLVLMWVCMHGCLAVETCALRYLVA